MPIDRMMRGLAAAVLLASTAVLSGCSSTVADMPGIGVPADAPARPKDANGYLPVHDLPPDRSEETMKPADQAKLEAELIAARNRQASEAAQNNGTTSSNAAGK
ncbi:hypothetical protein AS156_00585 [Bradyrhizobium macuxiense]|uniref:Lipoprotein n=1 Tax=Bradyrhizobium macuxiense TaxID=1755647 RepID=A0A109JSM2_9BRAD|nr:hypothetical protein [Bradyrhizobium macuxiense]KWV54264.1 hypothetical protein AS156_00585 [Bradyrhizobium macuxiense]